MQLEKRALASPPELRADGNAKVARGYAAMFNSETGLSFFRERIMPGAFSASLKDGDIRALVDHDTGRVIGRSTAGTLRLNEDDKGLFVEIDLPDTTDGRDLAVSLERGDISGMSFGFRVTHDEWDETVDPVLRTIHAVDLFEVSAVAFPAYGDTEIALRSFQASKEKPEAKRNAEMAERRIAERKAAAEQKFRKIA